MKEAQLNHPWLVLGLVVASTLLGLAGTDLVLPAVPSLPDLLGGSTARAQLVLAAYAGGTVVGLLVFGLLGDHYSTGRLFAGSLLAHALVAYACTRSRDIDTLVMLRALQGAVAAGPAVFAPGIVRALFDSTRAVSALGLLGSIEALAPAVAPIIGTWLLDLGGWQLSFQVIAALCALIAVSIVAVDAIPQTARRERGSYLLLLRDPVFLRYALSQALVLGGLLTFVFGMPAVLVRAFGGSLSQFIVMQLCGVAGFMLLANLSGRMLPRFGPERLISVGTGLACAGALATFAYALAGGRDALVITALYVPVGAGLGLRGPPGFFRAVVAARNDDARGAALVILGILGVATLGTAIAAPFVGNGLVHLAAVAAAFQVLAVASLAWLPRLN